ncbi:DNA mismatch repair protein Msh3-like [Mya arenaria]|uniref:DNA mismatch repair protein Msh3-like n=1 Tax=Mya arenaria TaxID=6604 RepID=UPI0022E071EC|nr:DNA mismatch repair protein Msh3-like [Mya arenaria]
MPPKAKRQSKHDSLKQPVLSKFFNANHNFSEKRARSVVEIIDSDDEKECDETLTPERKKQKISTENEQGLSKHEQSSVGLKEVVNRAKQKLLNFACESNQNDSKGTEAINQFDFSILKRMKQDKSDEISTAQTGDESEVGKNVKEKLKSFSPVIKAKKDVCLRSGDGRAVKYTPLEQQYMEFQEQCPDAVLAVECGYKYRFFGDDAKTASSVLKIFSHVDHNFLTASIPVHRLHVHVRRLVAAGHKVGVVRQTETAALKAAGANKSAPFTRKLSAIYTLSTLIGLESDSTSGEIDLEDPVSMATSYLACICDTGPQESGRLTTIGFIAVQPTTGDVVYDSFVDTATRSELETRLGHLQPVEVIVPQDVSMETHNLLNTLHSHWESGMGSMRIERKSSEIFKKTTVLRTVSDFYKMSTDLQFVLGLPDCIQSCLSALIHHLGDFQLQDVLVDTSTFTPFSGLSDTMQLDSCALRQLEVFHNQTDGQERGSLFNVVNHTLTKPGARLLRSWLAKPSTSYNEIMLRQEAVQHLVECGPELLDRWTQLLTQLPDIELKLTTSFLKKISPADFIALCESLRRLKQGFTGLQSVSFGSVTSTRLLDHMDQVPKLLDDVEQLTINLDHKAAKENKKSELFLDTSSYPGLKKAVELIACVTGQLQEQRRHVRLVLGQPGLEFTTVMGVEFLVEVRNSNIALVPKDWVKINSTKAVSRFHSPEIVSLYKELQQAREQRDIEAGVAWTCFLGEFSSRYQRYKQAVRCVAEVDCLLSLAVLALQDSYCKPIILEDRRCLDINGGRHPVVSQLVTDAQYVSNDTKLSSDREKVMLITGPNMGGKSCYIKQVALIALLGQIGSYVPAKSATLGILDGIYTRMGAADHIFRGQSTFMVEVEETSSIIERATSRSLVILDELGRGTSTHDGVAIAHATLHYFVKEVDCFTLFVTHYPILAELEDKFPGRVSNYHMSFFVHEESTTKDESREVITFLYQLVRGMASRSYGLNVARLAGTPQSIIAMATSQSHDMEDREIQHRKSHSLFRQLMLGKADVRKIIAAFESPA